MIIKITDNEDGLFVRWEVEEGKGRPADKSKSETELTFEGDIRVEAL